jgi:hypothetical protein
MATAALAVAREPLVVPVLSLTTPPIETEERPEA